MRSILLESRSARRAESIFGWGRAGVATGLEEARTGIPPPLAFTRMTARAVREQLLANEVTREITPAERTIHSLLPRLGYRMRRVRKTIPQKHSRNRPDF
jgi:hypothetical protein